MYRTMHELITAFPTLKEAEGTKPWDVVKFLTWAMNTHRGGSGASHAIRFVLNVANAGCDWPEYILSAPNKDVALLCESLREKSRAYLADMEGVEPSREAVLNEMRMRLSKLGPFNMRAAVTTWDQAHRRVIINYLHDPGPL